MSLTSPFPLHTRLLQPSFRKQLQYLSRPPSCKDSSKTIMARGTTNLVAIRSGACSGFGCLSQASQIGVVLSAVLATLVGAFTYWYAFIRPRLQKSHESGDEQQELEDIGHAEHHHTSTHRDEPESMPTSPSRDADRGKPRGTSSSSHPPPPEQQPPAAPPLDEPRGIGFDPLPLHVVTQNTHSFLPPPPPDVFIGCSPAGMAVPMLPLGPPLQPAAALAPAPFHQRTPPQPEYERSRHSYRLSLPSPGQAATISPVVSARHRSSSSLDQVSRSRLREMVDSSSKRNRMIDDEEGQYYPQPPTPIHRRKNLLHTLGINKNAESRIGRRLQGPSPRGRRRMDGVNRVGSRTYRPNKEIGESRIGRRPRQASSRDQHRTGRIYRDNLDTGQSRVGPRPQEQRPGHESTINNNKKNIGPASSNASVDSDSESSWTVDIYSPGEEARTSIWSPRDGHGQYPSEPSPRIRSSSSYGSRGFSRQVMDAEYPSRSPSQHAPLAGVWSSSIEQEANIRGPEDDQCPRPTSRQRTISSPLFPNGQDPVTSRISSTGALCSYAGSVGSDTGPGAGWR